MNRTWIVYACVAVLAFSAIVAYGKRVSRIAPVSTVPVSAGPLITARLAHSTHLIHQGPAPESFSPTLMGNGTAVKYRSGGRMLNAWLIKPRLLGPNPGLIYCHHGYALGENDIAAVQPFVDDGYVVLLPSFRGENGNHGSFEMFYGEVDDARAALEALATVPGIDRSRLFAAGYGAGGTVAMLLAESGAPLKAAVACSGFVSPDATTPPFDKAPIDWTDPLEQDLRSPARHIRDLSCPLHLYYGDHEQDLIKQAQVIPDAAQALGKTVTVTVIPDANESNVVAPWVRQAISDLSPYYTPPPPAVVNDTNT
jgi:dienelactone hydrolase